MEVIMGKIRGLFLFFLLLLTSSCANMTTIRHSADYDHQSLQNRKILLLPARAEVSMVGIGSSERMYDYEYHIEDLIIQELMPFLIEKNYKVKNLHKKELSNKNLADAYLGLRDSYDRVREELYTQSLLEEEKAFSITHNLGKQAKDLGQLTGSDILLVVDYVATNKTSGARALDLATNILFGSESHEETNKAVMIIGIIDAKNGNIIWTNMGVQIHDLFWAAFDNLSEGDKLDRQNLNYIIKNILADLENE